MNTEIQNIRIDDIQPSPNNTRKKVNAEELEELSRSIKAIGVLQPITVRPQLVSCGDEYDDYFEIVCGHRRYEAAKLAGLESVPCIVRNLSDEEAYEIMVTENLQRKDIDPFEESDAFRTLSKMGHDTDSLAERFGKSKSYIEKRMRLRNLIDEFRTLYDEGGVEITHCIILSRLDKAFQMRIYNEHYNADVISYSNLIGKPVKELKWAIERLGHKIKSAFFNTDGCANCSKSTGCDDLFNGEFSDAICEDPSCWDRKLLSHSLAEFDKARERYEDFFVIEPGKLTDKIDIDLEKELRARGYKFVKGNGYDYESVGSRYNASNDRIIGYTFNWQGFIAKRQETKVSCKPSPYKSEWNLNRLAEEREDRTKEMEMQAGLERLTKMSDEETRALYQANGFALVRHQLVLFASMADGFEFNGIKGGSDPKEIAEKVAKMESGQVAVALVRFIASYEDTEDVTFLSKAFPEPFKGNRAEAERKFLDECRENWHNYDEVTDEMIEEDLKTRTNKK